MKPFYRIVRTIIYPFFRWLQPVRIIGKENIPKSGAYILCSNHTSMTDPFFMATVFNKQIFFMSKAELFKVWILRVVLDAAGAFAVERGKGDFGAIEKATQLINDGKILGIFPEGTRYKEGAPRKAKSGVAYIAIQTGSDILPMSIYREGRYNLFKKTTIRIGELIKNETIITEDKTQRENLRCVVDTVTESITKLWEMRH